MYCPTDYTQLAETRLQRARVPSMKAAAILTMTAAISMIPKEPRQSKQRVGGSPNCLLYTPF